MSLQRKKQKQPLPPPPAASQDGKSSSFSSYIDDEQKDHLASIGMNIRKSISDGHKTFGEHNASLRHESFSAPKDVQNPLRGTYGPASSLGGYITKSFSAAPPAESSTSDGAYRGIGAEKYSLNRNKPIAALPKRKKRGRSETEPGSDEEVEKEVDELDDAGFPIIKLQPRESFQD